MFEDVVIEQTLHDNLGFEQGMSSWPVDTDCSAAGDAATTVRKYGRDMNVNFCFLFFRFSLLFQSPGPDHFVWGLIF